MTTSLIIGVITLLVIVVLMFVAGRGLTRLTKRKPTPLGIIASILVIFSAVFSKYQVVAYSLIGAALILAIYDLFRHQPTKPGGQPPEAGNSHGG